MSSLLQQSTYTKAINRNVINLQRCGYNTRDELQKRLYHIVVLRRNIDALERLITLELYGGSV